MASWVNFGRGTLWITWLGSCQEFETLLEYFFLIILFFLLKRVMLKQMKVMIYRWLNT